MKFKKYKSIQGKENFGWEDYIAKIKLDKQDVGIWQVTEKIHGANFSIWYDGEVMRFAKRSTFLGDGDSFFDYRLVAPIGAKAIQKAYDILKENGLRFKTVTIYCEIFGGSYPHKEVERKHVKRIQKGVYYSPDIHLYAFDLMIDGEYVDMDKTNWLFNKIGIFYAEPLFEGMLEECLQYPNKFQTTIPEKFGLPTIEDNICEGIVIRPIENRYIEYSEESKERVIIKSKNEKFWESVSDPEVKRPTPKDLSERGNMLLRIMESMITDNRFNNMMSKIGDFKREMFGSVIKTFQQDIREEFNKEFIIDYETLEKAEQYMLNKRFSRMVVLFLKMKLMK